MASSEDSVQTDKPIYHNLKSVVTMLPATKKRKLHSDEDCTESIREPDVVTKDKKPAATVIYEAVSDTDIEDLEREEKMEEYEDEEEDVEDKDDEAGTSDLYPMMKRLYETALVRRKANRRFIVDQRHSQTDLFKRLYTGFGKPLMYGADEDTEPLIIKDYEELEYRKAVLEKKISGLSVLQDQFDLEHTFFGENLANVVRNVTKISMMCTCLDAGQMVNRPKDCTLCSIPASILTTISRPDHVENCGGVYAVHYYAGRCIQLCGLAGLKITLRYHQIAAVCWLTCPGRITYLPLDDQYVTVRLGGGAKIEYHPTTQKFVLSNLVCSHVVFGLPAFAHFYNSCIAFACSLKRLGIVIAPFVPCWFTHKTMREIRRCKTCSTEQLGDRLL